MKDEFGKTYAAPARRVQIIRRNRRLGWRDNVALVVVALACLFRTLVELLTLGFFTSDVYEYVLFDSGLHEWSKGEAE